MFSSLRKHFGVPGLIAVIALVFAMVGGAYAASDNSGGDATASAKGKKKRNARRGKGLNVRKVRLIARQEARRIVKNALPPAGPQGPKGDPGANGQDGQNGQDGDDGTDGKSVEVNELVAGECVNEEGGAEVIQEGAAEGVEVCNGEEGSPWTAGGTLPSGATQTGGWFLAAEEEPLPAALSFPIPLAAPIPGSNVVVFEEPGEGETAECPGTAANPEAEPGFLCVYVGVGELPEFFGFAPITVRLDSPDPGASRSGALLAHAIAESPGAVAKGSFAVTAP